MKKLVLVGASVLMMSVMTIAQPGNPGKKSPQERAEQQTARLTKELSLTPEQATKVKAILATKGAEMDSVRAKKMAGGDKKEMHADRNAAREKTDAELKAVLTPEQYTKFQAMMQERKDKHQHGEGMKKKK
jgi:periplasmic protein CpxP/Spy